MKALKRLTIALFVALACISAHAASPVDDQKTVAILGDSYSTFIRYIPQGYACWYHAHTEGNDVHSVEQTWWSQLVEKTGMRLILNSSYSGSTICNHGYRGEDYSDRSYITRMKTDFVREDGSFGIVCEAPDVLLIFGGTNDDWCGAEMGEPVRKEDLGGADMYKCLPASSYMLSYLTEKLPQTRIIVIVNSDLSEKFTNGIQEVSKMYGVESLLLEGIDKQRNHPSALGMSQICEQVMKIL